MLLLMFVISRYACHVKKTYEDDQVNKIRLDSISNCCLLNGFKRKDGFNRLQQISDEEEVDMGDS